MTGSTKKLSFWEELERFFLLYVQATIKVSPSFKRSFAKTFIRQYEHILEVPEQSFGSHITRGVSAHDCFIRNKLCWADAACQNQPLCASKGKYCFGKACAPQCASHPEVLKHIR